MTEFWAGQSHCVKEISGLIRNGAAHGSLTPTGMGLSQKDRLATLTDLTDFVLADADARFSAWVNRKVAGKTMASMAAKSKPSPSTETA